MHKISLLMEQAAIVPQLLAWYDTHKRELPFRNTRDPYQIWLSEVILQQTRVVQGLPYYRRFLEAFPTIEALAQADLQTVLRLWQGLGYYARARNMHHTAQIIVRDYGGQFPQNYVGLLQLKGIGKYTAAAIASFAYHEPVAVLDGNVYRVLARVFGINTNIASPAAEREFRALAQALLPAERAADYNQALMEFGALQCTPAKPNCLFCPIQSQCVAWNTGQVSTLPVKEKKGQKRRRFLEYIVLHHQGRVAMQARMSGDIWEGLYEFYLIESDKTQLLIEEVLDKVSLTLKNTNFVLRKVSQAYTHLLTHQRICLRFWHIDLLEAADVLSVVMPQGAWYTKSEVQNLPKPILLAKYLEKVIF